jgi:hypothetical protein
MILGVFYFRFCRVSLAEYFLVLRALFPFVADVRMYYGYCINCLYPTMGEAQDHGQWSFTTSRLMLLLEMILSWHFYFELCVSV